MACVWVFGFHDPWEFPTLSPYQRLVEASLLRGRSLNQLTLIQHFYVAFVCLRLCQSRPQRVVISPHLFLLKAWTKITPGKTGQKKQRSERWSGNSGK